MTKHFSATTACVLILVLSGISPAAPVISDGSDGPFNPVGVTYTLNLPADGIFNFTTINIPAGVTVKFNRNAGNTPVYFAATGAVTIHGAIDVSATATNVIVDVPNNPKQSGGPGGGDGGNGGTGASSSGENGQGPGGGVGGYPGGGAGNATAGSAATRYGWAPGAGGPSVPFPDPFSAGSGGAGGDALFHYAWYTGGYGGGAGGAIQIATPGVMTLSGRLLANGANAGWGHASVLANGGPGGGGSGGCIDLYAGALTLEPSGIIQAAGGYGGGLGTQPYSNDPPSYSSGADGGLGYVRIDAGTVDLAGTIQGVQIIVPLPSTLCLLGWGIVIVAPRKRRSSRP